MQLGGIEPTTFSFIRAAFKPLNYSCSMNDFCKRTVLINSSAPGRNRTHNLLVKSQLLYQLSYEGKARCPIQTRRYINFFCAKENSFLISDVTLTPYFSQTRGCSWI